MSGGKEKEWFLQLGGETHGPFPSWQLSRYVILQRLDNRSLLSRDGVSWMPLGELPELHPERRLSIADLPEAERQRLQATSDWVESHSELFPSEKVISEEGEERGHRHIQTPTRPPPNRLVAYTVVIFLLLVIAAIPYLIPAPPPVDEPQCNAPAAPGVNWSNCLMSSSVIPNSDLTGASLRNVNLSSSNLAGANLRGADLAYSNLALSDLSGAQLNSAQLKGANLRNTDLTNANLAGADLSYADLSGAKLKGANISNALFGHAIWEENLSCMPHSVGKCIPARKVP